MEFSPCQGGSNCTEGGTQCNGCGRSHEEIAETRELIDGLAQYIVKKDYENVEDFLRFVAIKSLGKAHMLKVNG